ncbi:macoilin-1-like isoform X1 [Acipenser oxyrinchus oxyrinchus]|uniref:Macoilin-1-like isoform X1 n=1 Tax=Acipenser oxyrinchus oxyrinchus TaxID=40147 RepID=A0AAD8GCH3_ACIOX|nr:macoilin-1-like isoform X1 [Acipenser oxyrinchus oxyrinchus]
MKKRCVDTSRMRKMKRSKISERLSESAFAFLKFMVVWILVLLADFILEFRFEYLWPCWLFFGSVYTFFHCHGLVVCVVFVCAAFTLDVFCLIFVPLHWLFFAASTYIWFDYIWHTERGLCLSTVSLWILLVYIEAALRFKDLKNSHVNVSHLFAAHCIGYPVVYLGFDATCYFTSIVKLRIQKAVQKENNFFMQLLQQALPPGLQLYPRYETDCKESSKWMAKSDCTQYQCQNGAVVTDVKYLLDYSQIDCKDTNNDMEDTKPNDHSFQPSTFKANESDNKENCLNRSQTCETSGSSECLPQEEQGAKVQRTAKNTSPKVRKMLNRILVPIVKGEKKQKSSTKNISPNWEMSEPSLSANQNTPSEQIRKLEQEVKKLKSDLLTNKQSEQELRSHFCNLTNSERSLRPEISLLRQANDLLQNKIAFVIKTKQRDKQAAVLLEKKISAEMEARAIIEKQLSDLRTRKTDEASAITQGALLFTTRQEHTESLKKKAKELETDWNQLQKEFQEKEGQIINLENEVEVLCRYKGIEQDSEMLLSALSAMQDKTHHLEYNLSAETRIKLDLFSALGDARRQLEIAQGKLMKQDKEIGGMKQKIAEVMAVMPDITYGVQHPVTPQYLTKFVNSEHYVLDPNALMYQCLKK